MPQNKPTSQFTRLLFGRICDEVQRAAAAWGWRGHENNSKRSTTTNTQRPICTATSKKKGQKEGIEKEGEGENLITHSKFGGINQIQIENFPMKKEDWEWKKNEN